MVIISRTECDCGRSNGSSREFQTHSGLLGLLSPSQWYELSLGIWTYPRPIVCAVASHFPMGSESAWWGPVRPNVKKGPRHIYSALVLLQPNLGFPVPIQVLTYGTCCTPVFSMDVQYQSGSSRTESRSGIKQSRLQAHPASLVDPNGRRYDSQHDTLRRIVFRCRFLPSPGLEVATG